MAPATARTSHPAAHQPLFLDLQMLKAEERRGAPERRCKRPKPVRCRGRSAPAGPGPARPWERARGAAASREGRARGTATGGTAARPHARAACYPSRTAGGGAGRAWPAAPGSGIASAGGSVQSAARRWRGVARQLLRAAAAGARCPRRTRPHGCAPAPASRGRESSQGKGQGTCAAHVMDCGGQ